MNDDQFHFFLGRNEYISLAELESFFQKPVSRVRKGVVLLDEIAEEEVLKAQNILGGTIKIAQVLGTCSEQELDNAIIEVLNSEHQEGKKMLLAVNYYGKQDEMRFLKSHLMAVKKRIDFSLRFCNSNFKNVSSVITWKEIIRKGHVELNVVELERGKLQVSQTISCQNIDDYSKRDYEKPGRDARVGMLPPKLAQMLLNIAGKTQTVWDPFCGTGTILLEGLLAGKNMVGSDFSENMMELTEKNVRWFQQEFPTEGKTDLFKHDATDFVKINADAIVTEGYLGDPKSKTPNEDERQRTDILLSKMYADFFTHAKRNGIKTVVLCLPAYKMEKSIGFMKKTLASILQTGYNLAALSDFDRGSLLYSRDDQLVFREIFKFTL